MTTRDERRAEALDRLRRASATARVNPTPASEPQRKWIESLLDTRPLNDTVRAMVRQELDNGMSTARARDWIDVLRDLPPRSGRFV